MQNRALGKGLSALIPTKTDGASAEKVNYLKTDQIKNNPFQPRTQYNEESLKELMNSIQEKGVLQPILVREKNGVYEVVAGERRLRAARGLKMEEVPVVIREVSDQEALVLALIENIQREELNAIEEANAFKRLIDDFQLTQDQVAQSVGKNRSTVTNILRLLKLPAEIQKSVADGRLSEGHARALLGAEDAVQQKRMFEHAIANELSVRELENLVRDGFKEDASRRKKSKTTQPKDHNVVVIEESLQKTLGTKVNIVARKKRGKIVIEYYSNEDLDRIIGIIKK